MTPKGTRPGEKTGAKAGETPGGPASGGSPSGAKRPAASRSGAARDDDEYASGRYTAPIPASMRESPPWIPALMLGLLILGAILIILRNMVFTGNNWLTLLGLASILGGLYTATKWR